MELGNLILDEIDRGLCVEQVNEHIAQCIADIADVNKKATKKRSVVLTIDFHPSESRREAKLAYSVQLKPSSHIDRDPTTIFLGKDKNGDPIAKPWVPNQQELLTPDGEITDEADLAKAAAAKLPDSN